MSLTNEQILYRQYLTSPHWLAKRKEALDHYGTVCSVCRGFGTDVHHLTYVRLGQERMTDLQVLCRACHDVKHATLRATKRCGGNHQTRMLRPDAAYWFLSSVHRRILIEKFKLIGEPDLFSQFRNSRSIQETAGAMLGVIIRRKLTIQEQHQRVKQMKSRRKARRKQRANRESVFQP